MAISRRTLLSRMLAAGGMAGMGSMGFMDTAMAHAKRAAAGSPLTRGPFQANWSSLLSGYTAPDWFRDAKFGIWAHWGPQCVPAAGDWYARQMYLQGGDQYAFHKQHYGHPADVGFMEIIGKWKAERWDPERLIDLYRNAGAKYFVSMASHHDNFDMFASSHHPWNSTRVGPMQDIVGTWARLARERGMRFGVSNHSAHAWHWFQTAYGYDPEGPRAGERYDAFRLTKADGKGTWWEGLDPQELYTGRNMILPDGITSIDQANKVHERTDRVWTEQAPPMNPAFTRTWLLRCRELIDKYQPDLLYFDDFDLPLQQAGLEIAAHYYNSSMQWHGGNLEAVLNAKTIPPEREKALIADVERGSKDDIAAHPWQTDTCIGDWHYSQRIYEQDDYKTPKVVIHTLCDVASKNGNLLLNIPVRGDGAIDDKEEKFLAELTTWMKPYAGAIHGTRPWRVYGEGTAKARAGMFNEQGKHSQFGASDLRYMRKHDALHAFALGWPTDGVVRLPALGTAAATGTGTLDRVTLFGSDTPLAFTRSAGELEIRLPEGMERNDVAIPLVLAGQGIADA